MIAAVTSGRMAAHERTTLLGGLGFAEGPRWHDGRLWFSDMGASAVMAVDLDGKSETIVQVSSRPSGLGWLPDGRMLVVAMGERRLLRLERDELVEHADLSGLVSADCNDMVVDGEGRAYVGNAGFDLRERPVQPRPAEIVLVTPDGVASVVDNEIVFPNGSVVTPDGRTLIVAETFAQCLTAFDIESDGTLTNRRSFADLPGRAPDGICLDDEGAVWVADANGSACVRVLEGGTIADEVDTGRGCFACMLGGDDRRTLFLLTAEGYSGKAISSRTAAIEMVTVDVPGAGWP
jgi:sugar lactone lactonase YvrE